MRSQSINQSISTELISTQTHHVKHVLVLMYRHVHVCVVPDGKVVQAGGDVLAVVVNLFRVEGALAV